MDCQAQIEENVRLLRLIHEDADWTLARVRRAAELEVALREIVDAIERARELLT